MTLPRIIDDAVDAARCDGMAVDEIELSGGQRRIAGSNNVVPVYELRPAHGQDELCVEGCWRAG